ncbi:M96 mating-specific protein family [Phytophthora palmivora]|uniref:M96 mating-specific protein family n=1 Tax=Phytophthora palmivora TaxID=4796 RepID=A0A2P4X799_9STRA|nr:M96 mating-specific protein family [Phytophthora palmivora]
MEVTYKDTQVREGDDGIYLDVFSNKVLPFDLETTANAVWDHFKGADKHRGKVYEKTAKILDESDTIVENFAKEMYVGSTHAMFRVKQVLRRYVEEDRVVVVFISIKTPLEVVDEPFAGLTHRHQCYAVAKRSSVPPSQSVGPRCLLQMCSLVSLEHGQEQPEKDSPVMSAMTKFMMGAAANSITASQELIENALMDRAVNQPNTPSSLQQTARLQQMRWAEALLVCFVAVFLCGSYLFCFFYRRCCLQKRRYHEMARVPSATIAVSDLEEPLLGDSHYDQLPIIESVPLAHKYQPSAPPMNWENEHRGVS